MINDEAATCNICHDELLSKDICGLKCGHVYHHECIENWLHKKTNGNLYAFADCPLCKKNYGKDDLRPIYFDCREVSGVTIDEERRLEGATQEECEQRFEELSAQLSEFSQQPESLKQELSELCALARKHKQLRAEFVQAIPEIEEKSQYIVAKALDLSTKNAKMQVALDAETPHRLRRHLVQRPREDDADLREERRKLATGCRLRERVRQFQLSLGAAVQQDIEMHQRLNVREASAKEAADQLITLRREDSRIRRQREERKASSESLASISSKSSLEKSLTIENLDSQVELGNEASEARDGDEVYRSSAKVARTSIFSRGATPSNSALDKLKSIATQQNTVATHLQRRDSNISQPSQDLEASSQVSQVSLATSTRSKGSSSSKGSFVIEKLDIPVEIVSQAQELAQDEDDVDMLYGGTSTKTTRPRTLGREASNASVKGAVTGSRLFGARGGGSGTRPKIPAPTIAEEPISRRVAGHAMKSLFAKRQT